MSRRQQSKIEAQLKSILDTCADLLAKLQIGGGSLFNALVWRTMSEMNLSASLPKPPDDLWIVHLNL